MNAKLQSQFDSLIKDVVIKCQNENIDNAQYDKCYRKIAFFLAFLFVHNESFEEKTFKELVEYLIDNNLSHSDTNEFFVRLFNNYDNWLYKTTHHHFADTKRQYYLDLADNLWQEHNESDEFFCDDDACAPSDDTIHHMSSNEYFAQYPIEQEDVEELIIQKEKLEELLDEYSQYSQEFIDSVVVRFLKLETTLVFIFSNVEFKKIGVEILEFVNTLKDMHIKQQAVQDLIFNLIQTFIEDIIKWIDSIFIEQDVVDVHYLDDSLLANISQLKIMCEA
ncbi:MAG: hypothetical protein GXO40_05345 [Epsilonproteobacteria bacterium]|nr:hypothetical protein [Campylobacterota bacterium]